MKTKAIIAVLLIAASIGGMYYWETSGREQLFMTQVLAVSNELKEGEIIKASDLTLLKVNNDAVVDGALRQADLDAALGKVCLCRLPAGSQLRKDLFADKSELLSPGQSIFAIPGSWIFSRSSALRSGDTVSVYLMPEKKLLGTFRLAYIRNQQEQGLLSENEEDTVLQRFNLNGETSFAEIVCTKDEYFQIYDAVTSEPEDENITRYQACLLIVMEDAG